MSNQAKLDSIRTKYLQDADLMGSKSRFGYFSILPPCSAGDSIFQQKTVVKDQYGKVKTENRNIYSGPTASGMNSRSYFSYIPSIYKGDPYYDPGKIQRVKNKLESQKHADKEKFKPASLNKTSVNPSYEYLPQKSYKQAKPKRSQDGRVITENPNIRTNTLSSLKLNKYKQFKYLPDPYNNDKIIRRKQLINDIQKRGEYPFKAGSPVKEYFASYKQQFEGNSPIGSKIITNKPTQNLEQPFKPVCKSQDKAFSRPEYMSQGKKPKEPEIKIDKQPFKQMQIQNRLIKKGSLAKPCPSIMTFKPNLLRALR